MGARLLEGKEVADRIRKDLAVRISALKEKGVVPGLAVIIVGDEPASVVAKCAVDSASRPRMRLDHREHQYIRNHE